MNFPLKMDPFISWIARCPSTALENFTKPYPLLSLLEGSVMILELETEEYFIRKWSASYYSLTPSSNSPT